MANTTYGLNAAEAVKLWSRKLTREVLKETYAAKFIGTDTNSLCYLKEDLRKTEGDRIRCVLRMQLSGQGVQGDELLKGQEETLLTYTDDLYIDQVRHAVVSVGKMSEQRIPFSVREEARLGLQDWFVDRFDTWFMNQLAGNAGQTNTIYTGNNACISPDSTSKIMANSHTTELALTATASAIFTLGLIDQAVLKAKTKSPSIRPVKAGDSRVNYVMFITPEMHYDLRRNSTSMEWADIQKTLMQGGVTKDNPILTGALGIYNGVVLHEAFRLPIFTSTGGSKYARAVLCGAQALSLAFGREGGSAEKFSWVEEMSDYKNRLGIAATTIAGMKKTVYNSKDFATIAVYAAHSAAAVANTGR